MKILAWIGSLLLLVLIMPIFAQSYYYYGSYHPAQYPYYYRPAYHPYYYPSRYYGRYYTHPYGAYPYRYYSHPYTTAGAYPYNYYYRPYYGPRRGVVVRGFYPYGRQVIVNPGHAIGGAYYSPGYYGGRTCYMSGAATVCY